MSEDWMGDVECQHVRTEHGYGPRPAAAGLAEAGGRLIDLTIVETVVPWGDHGVMAWLQMTPAQARDLAARLIQAADELEGDQ